MPSIIHVKHLESPRCLFVSSFSLFVPGCPRSAEVLHSYGSISFYFLFYYHVYHFVQFKMLIFMIVSMLEDCVMSCSQEVTRQQEVWRNKCAPLHVRPEDGLMNQRERERERS